MEHFEEDYFSANVNVPFLAASRMWQTDKLTD